MGIFSLRQLTRRKPAEAPEEVIARFLRLPEHAWVTRDRPLVRSLAGFFSLLPAADLTAVLDERRLLLLYCNQKMSCTFYQFKNREIVLIFPDLRARLTSAQYLQGYAVLAHELAHVLHGHSSKTIAPLQAQLEADRYASDLGLREDLAAVLRGEGPSPELRERLAALGV